MSTIYSNGDAALVGLLSRLSKSPAVGSRNGNTRELMMQSFTVRNILDPYITVPGRKVDLPAQVAEMIWVLSGNDQIDVLSEYLPRAADFSDDGKTWRGAYGPRLRSWGDAVDQLQYVVDLLREELYTRRAVISIYDPSIDSDSGKDIPCNNWLHFLYRDGRLNLHVATRSNDVMWGWSGINFFEWSMLLQLVASFVGVPSGSITFSVSSLHLYSRHFKKAENILAATVDSENELDSWDVETFLPGPLFDDYRDRPLTDFWDQLSLLMRLEAKLRRGAPKKDLTPFSRKLKDPMLVAWLDILAAKWSDQLDWWDSDVAEGIRETWAGTALLRALENSPGKLLSPKDTEVKMGVSPVFSREAFVDSVDRLHRDKGAAYGDSWKKRGEVFSILPNIARKVDRLGVGGAGDTTADTAVDLLVYLVKYSLWLGQLEESSVDEYNEFSHEINRLAKGVYSGSRSEEWVRGTITAIQRRFNTEVLNGNEPGANRRFALDSWMIPAAFQLAERFAAQEGWSYRG